VFNKVFRETLTMSCTRVVCVDARTNTWSVTFISRSSAGAAEPIAPYHFEETKSLAAAQQTDFHYFRVVQYLRLSRRGMALAGLQLISATPISRLNAFFPYRPVEELLEEVREEVGDPGSESTRGQYARRGDKGPGCSMRDFRPHNWPQGARAGQQSPPVLPSSSGARVRAARLRAAIDDLPEIEVPLEEEA
jgi:hypothetical protein